MEYTKILTYFIPYYISYEKFVNHEDIIIVDDTLYYKPYKPNEVKNFINKFIIN